MKLQQAISTIRPLCADSMDAARQRLDNMAKPLGGLGVFEDLLVQLAGIARSTSPKIKKKCTVVMCADNGIVAQGVTQTGQEVTAIVTENLGRGETAVCHMSRAAGSDVLPVDVGVAATVTGERILHKKIAHGTKDFTIEPAMSPRQTLAAVEAGIEIACSLKNQGYQLLGTGEMGIGNTTTASAVAAVLLGLPPQEVTGRGAGLSGDGLRRKIAVISRGIALHQPDPLDPLDTLSKVGGLDIAALCGLYIGGAAGGLGVVMDGMISTVAALCAVRLCPLAREYLLPSHQSAEPACRHIFKALGCKPFICGAMKLGEGTGAVAAFALLDLMMAVYENQCTFHETNIQPYVPLV